MVRRVACEARKKHRAPSVAVPVNHPADEGLTRPQLGCIVLALLLIPIPLLSAAWWGMAGSVLVVSNHTHEAQDIKVLLPDGRIPFAGRLDSGFESAQFISLAGEQPGVWVATPRGVYMGHTYTTHSMRWQAIAHADGVKFWSGGLCEELTLLE